MPKKKEILVILPLLLIGFMDVSYALTISNPDPYTEKPVLTVEQINQGYKFSIAAGNNQIFNQLKCGDYTFYDRVPVTHWIEGLGVNTQRSTINPVEIRWAGPINAVDTGWGTQKFSVDRSSVNDHYSVSFNFANPYDKSKYEIFYKATDPDGDLDLRFGRNAATVDQSVKSQSVWNSLTTITENTANKSGIATPTAAELSATRYVSMWYISGDTTDRMAQITMAYPRILPDTNAFEVPYFFGYEARFNTFTLDYNYQNMQRGDVAYIRTYLANSIIGLTTPSSETWPIVGAITSDMKVMDGHKGNMYIQQNTGWSNSYENHQIDVFVADSDLDRKILKGSHVTTNSQTSRYYNAGDLMGMVLRPVFPVTSQTVPDLEKNEMFIPAYYFSGKEYECKATAVYFEILNSGITSLESEPVNIKKSTNPWNCEKQDYTLKDSELVRESKIVFNLLKPDEYCQEGLFDEELELSNYPVMIESVPVWREHLKVRYDDDSNRDAPDLTKDIKIYLEHGAPGSFAVKADADNSGCRVIDKITGKNIGKTDLIFSGTNIVYGDNKELTGAIKPYHGHELRCALNTSEGPITINIGIPPFMNTFDQITEFIKDDPYGLGVSDNIFGMPLTATFAILISMVGYNRRHIPVAAILFITTFSVLAYMQLVDLPQVLVGILIVVSILLIFSKGFK